MAYIYFDSMIQSMDRMGVTDIVLPFLLIFTLVFAVLEKTKIMGVKPSKNGVEGRPKTNLNVIISLIMGLAVVIPHATRAYPPGRDVVELLNNALPSIAMLIVAIFSFILLLGMFSGKQPSFLKSNTIGGIVVILAVIAVAIIFIDSANIYIMPSWLYFLDNPETQGILISIAVFGLLIWFITRDDDRNTNDGSNGTMKQLNRLLNGGEGD